MPRIHGSLLLLILALLAAILLPFALWGEHFDAVLSLEGARAWMLSWGPWAWLAGVAAIVSDIVLPVPATVVMSAIGWVFGWFLGGCICAIGSMLAGVVAYAGSRWLGRGVAAWLAGEDGLQKAEALFAKHGGWLVAVSRWTPVLPEAVACLAGIARMPWRVFIVALACGSVPLGFAFAAIGHLGHAEPGWAMALSALVPVLLWLTARRLLTKR
ncbi:MAG: VTT domain-containing protein [Verrucomicrobiaceae bacterium]|nr:VTT domain-containing protein [Verrucomicrobiaceae bacterium]